MNTVAHDCDLGRCGNSVISTRILKSKTMPCLHFLYPHRHSTISHSFTEYTARDGLLYFRIGNFITPSNCRKHRTLRTFMLAREHILACADDSELDNCDIVVAVCCVSFHKPRYNYYIADHARQTIRWIHGNPPERFDREHAPIRSRAHYWHHVATFPAHRFCNRIDLQNAQDQLDQIRTGNAPPVLGDEIEMLTFALETFANHQDALDMHATFSVARVNRAVAQGLIANQDDYNSSHDEAPRRGLLNALWGQNLFQWRRNPPLSLDETSHHPVEHTPSPEPSALNSSVSRVNLGDVLSIPQPTSSGWRNSRNSEESASGSSGYWTALSRSLAELPPPPSRSRFESSSSRHSPTHSSPLARAGQMTPLDEVE